LGLLGLILLVAGYRLSRYIPLSPHLEEQARRFDDLRQKAADSDLGRRLDEMAGRLAGGPPYLFPGRLVMLVGFVLFVIAGVQMYRQPARAPVEEVSAEPAGPDQS